MLHYGPEIGTHLYRKLTRTQLPPFLCSTGKSVLAWVAALLRLDRLELAQVAGYNPDLTSRVGDLGSHFTNLGGLAHLAMHACMASPSPLAPHSHGMWPSCPEKPCWPLA